MEPAFYFLNFFYSPWNDAMKKRKLQIGPTLSQHSVRRGLGSHHLTTIEKIRKKIQILCNLNYGSPVIPRIPNYIS